MKKILLILFAHWIADFVCQTDKMAMNKSKSNRWLSIHVGVYVVVVFVFSLFIFTPWVAILWALVNGSIHYIQDYITSRINSKLYAAKQNHLFFVSIGFDQLLHFTCLLLTYEYLK